MYSSERIRHVKLVLVIGQVTHGPASTDPASLPPTLRRWSDNWPAKTTLETKFRKSSRSDRPPLTLVSGDAIDLLYPATMTSPIKHTSSSPPPTLVGGGCDSSTHLCLHSSTPQPLASPHTNSVGLCRYSPKRSFHPPTSGSTIFKPAQFAIESTRLTLAFSAIMLSSSCSAQNQAPHLQLSSSRSKADCKQSFAPN